MKHLKLLLLLLLLIIGACSRTNLKFELTDDQVNDIIQQQKVDFNNILVKDWDEVYIFMPYTPKEVISEELGVDFRYFTDIESSEIYLVVFKNNNKIINYCEFYYEWFQLDISEMTVLTSEEAVIYIKP
ncbi:MAG: hypothetical protein H9W82_15620 [Lactobacillus sp.]|nr:hypothetical protein [Lactobacillus sp.]